MSLLDTLNYFIQDQEGHLQCLEWDIREETNYENNDIDWYCERYDEAKQRVEDLKQIKSIVEHLEQNK
jgi:predicted GNAT superfamily acetyltransferase